MANPLLIGFLLYTVFSISAKNSKIQELKTQIKTECNHDNTTDTK